MRRLSLLVLALALVVAACTSSGDEPEADASGPLVLQVSGEPEETAVYRTVVNAFEKDHPDADIKLVEIADKDDHLARLTTSFAAGEPPDVFLVNFREFSQFVVRDAVEAIEPHLGDAGIDLDDYFEQPIEAFGFDGQLQCMPQNISSLVVYYNRSLFQRAGLDHPRSWTWEEFRQAAIDLTDGEVHGLGIDPQVIRLAPFVWSNGGDIVDDLSAPSRFTLEEPPAREVLEAIVSLVRDDEVVPDERELAAQDLETRFVTGKLGMLLSSRRDTPVFREVLGLDWDVAP